MQLVAYGAQDIYLTGNPQITFFKVVYRRHTNFSMESIEQTFNGTANFGRRVTATISRNGDLIYRMYVQATLPKVDKDVIAPAGKFSGTTGAADNDVAGFRWTNWIGHKLLKEVEIEIGGQRIDKHYSAWLHIWNELTQTAGHKVGYASMVGNVPQLVQPIMCTTAGGTAEIPETQLYIPLQFWFCRNPGLALPLIALQYHEVKINVVFEDLANCRWLAQTHAQTAAEITAATALADGLDADASDVLPDQDTLDITTPVDAAVWSSHSAGCCGQDLVKASLWVDYIYLDTDERRRFAQVSHEYLIEQLQFTGDESVGTGTSKVKLNFNHPVKELVWVTQEDKVVESTVTTSNVFQYGGPQWFNYTDAVDKTYTSGTPGNPMGEGMVGPNSALNNGVPYNQLLGDGTTSWSQFMAMAGVTADTAAGAGRQGARGRSSLLNDTGVNCTKSAKLQLNGHDRFAERDGRYFNLVQPYQHHTNVPAIGINVYSFGLKPEEHQPSGTCNMSRIDNATLQLTASDNFTSGNVKVFAVNYNVLRIMSGMGGLAYSN